MAPNCGIPGSSRRQGIATADLFLRRGRLVTAKKERNTTAKVAAGLLRARSLHKGLVAALLLSTSSMALHAEDRDLQRELDALKAQISSLKAAVAEQRSETKKNKEKIKVVADRAIAPPVAPPGYTAGGFQPIGGYDDKKLHFGGITLTPGGFVAAEGIFRSRTTGADVNTPFWQLRFPEQPAGQYQRDALLRPSVPRRAPRRGEHLAVHPRRRLLRGRLQRSGCGEQLHPDEPVRLPRPQHLRDFGLPRLRLPRPRRTELVAYHDQHQGHHAA